MKQIEYNYNSILKNLKTTLKALRISHKPVKPWTAEADGEIHLTGKYSGTYIQVGDGFYIVCKPTESGISLTYGTGNLKKDIADTVNYSAE